MVRGYHAVPWEKTLICFVFQSDMQKVLRHARKLPDKQQQFYKVSILDVYHPSSECFGVDELHATVLTWQIDSDKKEVVKQRKKAFKSVQTEVKFTTMLSDQYCKDSFVVLHTHKGDY